MLLHIQQSTAVGATSPCRRVAPWARPYARPMRPVPMAAQAGGEPQKFDKLPKAFEEGMLSKEHAPRTIEEWRGLAPDEGSAAGLGERGGARDQASASGVASPTTAAQETALEQDPGAQAAGAADDASDRAAAVVDEGGQDAAQKLTSQQP